MNATESHGDGAGAHGGLMNKAKRIAVVVCVSAITFSALTLVAMSWAKGPLDGAFATIVVAAISLWVICFPTD